MYNDEWPIRPTDCSDYEYGYKVGFDDHIIPHWQLQKYSEDFQKGYLKGKDLIDHLVDDAAQNRFYD